MGQNTDPMLVQDRDPTMFRRDMDHLQVDRDKDRSVASHRHFQREVIRVQRDRNTQDNLKFQGILFHFFTNPIT